MVKSKAYLQLKEYLGRSGYEKAVDLLKDSPALLRQLSSKDIISAYVGISRYCPEIKSDFRGVVNSSGRKNTKDLSSVFDASDLIVKPIPYP